MDFKIPFEVVGDAKELVTMDKNAKDGAGDTEW